MTDTCAEEMVPPKPANLALEKRGATTFLGRFWGELTVLVLAITLWLPRITGPIDLRWDAGVYYVLGTSLAQGDGYRILSEPGSPQALQYPPLLPAIVAAHQLVLGTSDWHVVAPWVRKTYAILFLCYGLATLTLARRFLPPLLALIATVLCMFQISTIFFSDGLFTELPFATATVLFVLVACNREGRPNRWGRETGSFVLATAGFLLKTIGVALFAAWSLEAFARKRWGLGLVRTMAVLVPMVAWYGYGMRVRQSYDYRHPAYEYQRAPYLFYNVSYAENALLADSARPEEGRITPGGMTIRIAKNVPSFLLALGETISTVRSYWDRLLNYPVRHLGRHVGNLSRLTIAPVLLLVVSVLAGLYILGQRGAILILLIVTMSGGLICATPWPGQFQRYATPLAPFLAIAASLALLAFSAKLKVIKAGVSVVSSRSIIRIVYALFLILTLVPELYAASQIFYFRHKSRFNASGAEGARFFFYDKDWVSLERAFAWIGQNAPGTAIVATPSSHLCYLLTGHRAVSPPVEPDPTRARHLLESVPVSYVIVDESGFTDVSRRYARPAVESDPANWRLAFSPTARTKVYEHPAPNR